MIVLGTKPGEHDACFALVKDGEPLFIYEQERFNRVKHGMSSDLTVLFEGLAEYDIAPGDVDVVAIGGDQSLIPERLGQLRGFLSGPALARAAENVEWRHPTFRRMMVAAGFQEDRVVDVRHHVCHVAGVFYASPFSDAAVLSVDASGEADTAMLAHCSRRDGINILRTIGLPHYLGRFYEAGTHWLGWQFGEEGKTMALAAYGDPKRYLDDLAALFHVDPDGFFEFDASLTTGDFAYSTEELVTQIFEELFGPRRRPNDVLEQHHMDVAAAVQCLCERVMVRLAVTLQKQSGSSALLLAGGVGLNSVSNGAIRRQGIFRQVVAFPQATDAGTALGAALYVYHRQNRTRSHSDWEMRHAFLGREIDLAHVHEAAAAVGIEGSQCRDPAAFAADRLAAGQIVGWIQGRAEIGPRALGNRSILGNPLTVGIKSRINAEVKHREEWRPFAPSVLEEDLGVFFETTESLPFMTIVASVRAQWRDRFASICHVDGTARVGSVTESFNPLFYRLIHEFKRRSGIGVVLNTSFNDRGEPLVQTCEQALRLFVSSGMDVLIIGDWVFEGKRDGLVTEFNPLSVNCKKLFDRRTLVVALRDIGHLQRSIDVLLREETANVVALCTIGEREALRFSGEVLLLDSDADVLEVASNWPQVVVLVPWNADKFIFDAGVYYSEIAETCRQLIELGTCELFWIDPRGEVVLARNVLYVHHPAQPPGIAAAYAQYW
jgi:carbamoyltransferase